VFCAALPLARSGGDLYLGRRAPAPRRAAVPLPASRMDRPILDHVSDLREARVCDEIEEHCII